MERREHEVAGLRDGQRRLDRLQVPHFADQDDVGVLPKNIFERLLEPLRVRVHLPLVHEAFLVRVEILDRVLDRDDAASDRYGILIRAWLPPLFGTGILLRAVP